jgi:hypothetical protein
VKTPVAFLIFNRPDVTVQVFAAIARAKPPVLLVVADGPRAGRAGEAEKCAQARAVVDRVDWDCRVLKNYADSNLGCRRRVSSGLDWVFETVEEAIILEDDCLPAASFFPYCDALLERYRHDTRVMAVSGDNFQRGVRHSPYSYYFSKYNHIWGWASWRRAWRHYDVEMRTWPQVRDAGLLPAVCPNREEERQWTARFDAAHQGAIDTWDYAWTYACWSQSGLTALPEVNLVTNLGFGPAATHTTASSWLAGLATGEMDLGELRHPPFVVRNEPADAATFQSVFATTWLGRLKTRLWRAGGRVRRGLRSLQTVGRRTVDGSAGAPPAASVSPAASAAGGSRRPTG